MILGRLRNNRHCEREMLKLLSQAFSQGALHQVNYLLTQGHPPIYVQLSVFTLLFIAAYLYPRTKRILARWRWREVSLLPLFYFGGCILLVLGWGNSLGYIYDSGVTDPASDLLHSYFDL